MMDLLIQTDKMISFTPEEIKKAFKEKVEFFNSAFFVF